MNKPNRVQLQCICYCQSHLHQINFNPFDLPPDHYNNSNRLPPASFPFQSSPTATRPRREKSARPFFLFHFAIRTPSQRETHSLCTHPSPPHSSSTSHRHHHHPVIASFRAPLGQNQLRSAHRPVYRRRHRRSTQSADRETLRNDLPPTDVHVSLLNAERVLDFPHPAELLPPPRPARATCPKRVTSPVLPGAALIAPIATLSNHLP